MQPLHSGIISIPGPPKTWTWKLSPMLVPKITEKNINDKKVPEVGPGDPKMTLKSIKMET